MVNKNKKYDMEFWPDFNIQNLNLALHTLMEKINNGTILLKSCEIITVNQATA